MSKFLYRAPAMGLLLAAAVIAGQAEPSSAADPQVAFNNNCRTCHSTDQGDHRLGPALGGIVGKKAGSQDGYSYSAALSKADFEWTPERLDQFIADPNQVVSGNNMKPYSGIDDPAVRKAIVDHLSSTGN